MQASVVVVRFVHETGEHGVDTGTLLRGVRNEDRSVFAQIVLQFAEDGTGDVTTFDGFLVEVLVECCRCGAEHRADIDVHDGGVRVIRREVDTEKRTEVVGCTHDGAEVGIAVLAGIGHLREFFREHPERERVAKDAFVHVGTFGEDGLGDRWRYNADGRLGFGFQFLVRLAGLFLVAVLLFEPAHGFVTRFEGLVHDEGFDVGGKGFTGRLCALDEDL